MQLGFCDFFNRIVVSFAHVSSLLCFVTVRRFWTEKMSDDESKEEKELDLTSPDVVTKYKTAAEIVNSNEFFFFPLNNVKNLLFSME